MKPFKFVLGGNVQILTTLDIQSNPDDWFYSNNQMITIFVILSFSFKI